MRDNSRAFPLLAMILFFCGSIAAQERTVNICRPIGPEPRVGSSGPDSPYCSPVKPAGYEINRVYVDNAGVRAKKLEGSYVIVIARLGTGEKSRQLNLSRLREMQSYLEQVVKAKVVTAEGERVKGFGRVEIYVAGRLLYVLPTKRDASLGLLELSP